MDLAQQYDQTLQSTIGLSQRERNRALRQQQESGSSQLSNIPGSSNWSDRGVSGYRGAGFKEVNNAPTIDADTSQALGSYLGGYTEGNQRQAGYYGDINPYTTQGADTLFGKQGYKAAAGKEDQDYVNAGFDLPTAWGKTYFKDYDFTQKHGVDAYLGTQGWKDLGQGLDLTYAGLIPELQNNLTTLKGSIYGKDGADPRNIQFANLQDLTTNLANQYRSKYTISPAQFLEEISQLPNDVYQKDRWGLDFFNNGGFTVDEQGNKLVDEAALKRLGITARNPTGRELIDRGLGLTDKIYEQMVNGFSYNGKNYKTQQEADAALNADIAKYTGLSKTQQSELLGQLLTQGGLAGTLGQKGSFGGNNLSDVISGDLMKMFGSKDITYGGKTYGTILDMAGYDPLKTQWSDKDSNISGGLFNKKKNISWDTGASQMARGLNNEDWWKQNAKSLGNGQVLLTPEQIKNSPGFVNYDQYVRDKGSVSQKLGFLQSIFHTIDPIIDAVDPAHNLVQKWTTGHSDTEGQAPYFQKIAPMIVDYFLPGVGSALGAADSASLGNWGGAIASGIGSYLGMSGGLDTGMGSLANGVANGAINAGLKGIGNAVDSGSSKGLLQNIIAGAASGGITGSGLGNAITGSLVNSGLSQNVARGLSDFTVGAGSGALNNMMGKNTGQSNMEAALSSGVGRTLGGIFNTATDTTNRKQVAQNYKASQDLAKTLSLLRKR